MYGLLGTLGLVTPESLSYGRRTVGLAFVVDSGLLGIWGGCLVNGFLGGGVTGGLTLLGGAFVCLVTAWSFLSGLL